MTLHVQKMILYSGKFSMVQNSMEMPSGPSTVNKKSCLGTDDIELHASFYVLNRNYREPKLGIHKLEEPHDIVFTLCMVLACSVQKYHC